MKQPVNRPDILCMANMKIHITDQTIHTQIGDYYANAMGIRR